MAAIMPEKALADLLISLFTEIELRQFISFGQQGSEIAAALPSPPASLVHVVGSVVQKIRAYGIIDDFFDRLKLKFHGRVGDITVVHVMFTGSSPSAPCTPGVVLRSPTADRISPHLTPSAPSATQHLTTLKTLVDEVRWEDIIDTITIRTKQPQHRTFFDNILRQARTLTPEASSFRICATYTVDDMGDYIHISGVDGTLDPDTCSELRWNISSVRWEEWLGMEIDVSALMKFSAADIVAACIYEMSWDGRSQKLIRKADRSRGNHPVVFMSYASEDKDEVARPLACALDKLGIRPWFDEFELSAGDSLRKEIASAISKAKFAVVILSRAFFRKAWTERELAGIISRETSRKLQILPIWHGVTAKDVRAFDPSLADKVGISTRELSIDVIAIKIEESIYVGQKRRRKG